MAAALVLSVAPVCAQEKVKSDAEKAQGTAKKGARARFEEMDTNKDGKISKEEWKRRERAFSRIDTNRDGFVTREEMKAARKKGRRK